MTATQTLREPKAKMPREKYDRFCDDEFVECQRLDGVPEDEIITTAEIVAIVKEVRAESYAEDQKRMASSR
jgi:hypothetical protein